VSQDTTPPSEVGVETPALPAVDHAPSTVPGTHGDPLSLEAITLRLLDRFTDARTDVFRGELTVFVDPAQLVEVLTFCRGRRRCARR
jgi:hypothetical protein